MHSLWIKQIMVVLVYGVIFSLLISYGIIIKHIYNPQGYCYPVSAEIVLQVQETLPFRMILR